MKFNTKILKKVLTYPIESFEKLGKVTNSGGGRWGDERHIYIDRGSNVLGVAHLDSVQTPNHFWINQDYIVCPTIDNRLGAWLMLYGLPSLGVVVDVLLTENEEMCMSTAQYFEAEKQYNWMFSFDRMGDDVVTYQYGNASMKQLLMSYGFDVGFGSYSDIVELDHLGCWGMNLGCGMHDYHSQKAYADIGELADQVDKFTQFYWDNKEIHFGYERAQRHSKRVTHPHGWDEEWDEGFWYETRSYVPGEAAIRYISDRYADDKYEARMALEAPAAYFDGETNGDDWAYDKAVWPADDPEMPDEIVDLYSDGVLVICDYCDTLFPRECVRKYHSLNATLCKRCFYLFAESGGVIEPQQY